MGHEGGYGGESGLGGELGVGSGDGVRRGGRCGGGDAGEGRSVGEGLAAWARGARSYLMVVKLKGVRLITEGGLTHLSEHEPWQKQMDKERRGNGYQWASAK